MGVVAPGGKKRTVTWVYGLAILKAQFLKNITKLKLSMTPKRL